VTFLLDTTITVGQYSTWVVAGITLNSGTIIATLVASAIVLAFGFYLRHVVTDGVPGRLQATLEMVWTTVDGFVEQMVGSFAAWLVPLVVTLFFFILVANWLELIPTGGLLVSPTADTNLTFGLAFTVIILLHVTSVRRLGWRRYLRVNYAHPEGLPRFLYPLLVPINVITQISYPLSLSLRLFGNIFAAALMLQIIGLLPLWGSWLPEVAWKSFEAAFVDVIQAFIFALLTVIYMSLATSGTERTGEEETSVVSSRAPRTESEAATAG
jgi:F-type H+-transporting ATPase subunit a